MTWQGPPRQGNFEVVETTINAEGERGWEATCNQFQKRYAALGTLANFGRSGTELLRQYAFHELTAR
jgi:hypothetical protein